MFLRNRFIRKDPTPEVRPKTILPVLGIFRCPRQRERVRWESRTLRIGSNLRKLGSDLSWTGSTSVVVGRKERCGLSLKTKSKKLYWAEFRYRFPSPTRTEVLLSVPGGPRRCSVFEYHIELVPDTVVGSCANTSLFSETGWYVSE